MDNKTWLGSLAEAKAVAFYTEQHWNVFIQATGKAPFDLVIEKDGEVKRVSVKGTAQKARYGNSYVTELRSVRHNSKGYKVKKMDPELYDELFVYVQPIDKCFSISSEDVGERSTINLGR